MSEYDEIEEEDNLFPDYEEDEEDIPSSEVIEADEVTDLTQYEPQDIPLEAYPIANVRISRKVGRRSKLTKKFIKKIEDLLLLGNYDEVVCDMVGISRNTYYRWLRLGEQIEQDFEELDETTEYEWDFDKPEDRKKALAVLGRDERDVIFYDFFQVVKRARGKSMSRLLTLVQAGANQDPYLAMKLMEKRYPKYFDTKRVEITGADGADIKISSTGGNFGQDEIAAAEIAKILNKAQVRELQSGRDFPDNE